MHWLPLIVAFLYVYIEISIFVQVTHVLGILLTLMLVTFASAIGMSLVRNQSPESLVSVQQKMAIGESPAAEMIKSISLITANLLLLLPDLFTNFPGSLLLLPPVQKRPTVKLIPHLRLLRIPGGGLNAEIDGGNTFDGECQRKDDDHDRFDHKDDYQD